ncbi:LacI family DNA-binding transcriptional regulator [Kibdelosporangium phytohabitans]|uniref:LacI family transcriptional regulator n=1 Tax=Kibdelosporangium phytohabitans TaxID=860235 RepID=A0A0N9HZ56_9PSEU|nr:substrate-binding domain-containing protein [Kibdelosporangium phytohabitans]ALG09046.1 LacI family transcriptional regulator [Kibdelosporangium phytohabitans]MBE1469768.1 LacI family transcriptional regulator [Kibdelosporangium phytohabitans]
MAPSIKDVAVRAGVSIGTVSNVLNRPDKVAEATRDQVLAAIAELGFVRNSSAAQLRAGTSRSLGLIVLDMANPFFHDVAKGVEDIATELGYAVVLCNSDEQAAREDRYLQVLEEQRVRGVLITPVEVSSERLDALRRRGTPTVLVDRHDPRVNCCSVAVDDVAGGQLAGVHLVARGHRRIAYFTGPLTIRQCADRLEGLRSAVRDAGLDPDTAVDVIELPALKARISYEAARAVFERATDVTAAFCANDLLALGLLRAAVSTGRRVPGDIAIMGYDDIEFAADAAVPLSSIRQPTLHIGRNAAGLLLEECDYPDTHDHQQVMFKPELVVREST